MKKITDYFFISLLFFLLNEYAFLHMIKFHTNPTVTKFDVRFFSLTHPTELVQEPKQSAFDRCKPTFFKLI